LLDHALARQVLGAAHDFAHMLFPDKPVSELTDLVCAAISELQHDGLIVVFRHDWETGWDAEVGEAIGTETARTDLLADRGAHRRGGKQLRLMAPRCGRPPRLYADRLARVRRIEFTRPEPEEKLFFELTGDGEVKIRELPDEELPDLSGNVPPWPNRRVSYVNGFARLSDDEESASLQEEMGGARKRL
jgi:hypothetical protein